MATIQAVGGRSDSEYHDIESLWLKGPDDAQCHSIPSNLAEGAERKCVKEFANFISYSSGSCAELMTQLMIAKEIGEIDVEKADGFIVECREISKMLYALRKSLN